MVPNFIFKSFCHFLIPIQVILVYKRADLLSDDHYAAPCSVIEMHVSVISMIFLRDDLLAVLTTSGLHIFECHRSER